MLIRKLANSVAIALLVVTGCSKDDPTASLVGTWKLATYSITGCDDTLSNEPETPCTAVLSVLLCSTIVFTETTFTTSINGLPGFFGCLGWSRLRIEF